VNRRDKTSHTNFPKTLRPPANSCSSARPDGRRATRRPSRDGPKPNNGQGQLQIIAKLRPNPSTPPDPPRPSAVGIIRGASAPENTRVAAKRSPPGDEKKLCPVSSVLPGSNAREGYGQEKNRVVVDRAGKKATTENWWLDVGRGAGRRGGSRAWPTGPQDKAVGKSPPTSGPETGSSVITLWQAKTAAEGGREARCSSITSQFRPGPTHFWRAECIRQGSQSSGLRPAAPPPANNRGCLRIGGPIDTLRPSLQARSARSGCVVPTRRGVDEGETTRGFF